MDSKARLISGQARSGPLRRDGCLEAVLAILIISVTACGSGPSQQSQALGRVLSRCMRAHGIRSFPDAAVSMSNGRMNISVSSGTLAYFRSPMVRAGLRTCQGVVARADTGGPDAG